MLTNRRPSPQDERAAREARRLRAAELFAQGRRYKALPLASHGSCIRRSVALNSWSMTFNVRSIA
jgi:hypothetical protein